MRCPRTYKTKHQDITFKTRRTYKMDTHNKEQQEIGKEPDLTNTKDLLEYI